MTTRPTLHTPLASLPRVTRRIIPALERLGIHTVRDLLFHLPARYEDFSNQKPIREIAAGEIVTVQGRIKNISMRRTAKKHMTLVEATVEDPTGRVEIIWFNQPFLARNLRQGDLVQLSGKVAQGPRGMYLQSPAYEKLQAPSMPRTEPVVLVRGSKFQVPQEIHTEGLVAIYPETKGISSRWIRFLIKSFVALGRELPDPLPEEMRRRHALPTIGDAIFCIHFPRSPEDARSAERRFQFEELLLLQLCGLRERLTLKTHKAPPIPTNILLIKKFVQSLAFALTDAQRRSLWEIIQDLAKPRPMNRLLEGDVGSGKTVVAAAAALLTVEAGYRAAFMAPTEILARQHFATLSQLLAPFGISVGLLVGAEKKVPNAANIIVGTHALIQKGVRFENLGLVVVDEQHRFGVSQRAMLVERGKDSLVPHFLSMTATPIPRTLALAVWGDLDLSLLDEMPKSRTPVITKIVEPAKRDEAYRFIRGEVKKGRQVFVVCPRIEPRQNLENENPSSQSYQQQLLLFDVKTVKEEYKKLSEKVFPDLAVGMLHGRMKSKEKDAVMKKFRNREYDILVSTSVIEVGVDIPNASVMMIEGAERFGLAQLHQFRGRVGRGSEQSYCFLFPTEDGMATRRLRAVVEAKNGFELAEKDLAIRGPGSLLGSQQWGVPDSAFRAIADAQLVKEVRNAAVELIKKDLALDAFPELKRRVGEMAQSVHIE